MIPVKIVLAIVPGTLHALANGLPDLTGDGRRAWR